MTAPHKMSLKVQVGKSESPFEKYPQNLNS